MIIDKEEHKALLIQMVDMTNFPGKLLETALELKKAIQEAKIEPKKPDNK